MRIVLSNGRQFLIKVRYVNVPCYKTYKDEFGRDHEIYWDEKTTIVDVSEWFKKEPNVNTTTIGKAHCAYQDTFDKNIGKNIAYTRALFEMENNGIINYDELEEMEKFGLNKTVYYSESSKTNKKSK